MIKTSNLSKNFGKEKVLSNINLEINEHEFVVLLGPSGCGKTTFLRLLSGLEQVTDGHIYFDGKDVNKLPPKERNVSMVFQNYALFPDMNVYQNIAFGLQIRKKSKKEINEIINKISVKLKIDRLLSRKPNQLSGGEQQRVAIARAMVKNPKIYLFDEPLSNLDVNLKDDFMKLIKDLHKETQSIFIYVTHAQNEALKLADKIVLMNEGNILQVDTPLNIYKHPKNLFVANFIGEPKINIFKVKNKEFSIGIRPENIMLNNSDLQDCICAKARVISTEFLGNGYVINATIGDNNFRIFSLNKLEDNMIEVVFNLKDLLVFDEYDNLVEIDLDKLKIINEEFVWED